MKFLVALALLSLFVSAFHVAQASSSGGLDGPIGTHAPVGQDAAMQAPAETSPPSLASTVVGWVMVLGGSLYKLPQVSQLYSAQSYSGVSVSSVLVETISYVFTIAYSWQKSYPFNTYGESVAGLVQNFAILSLILFIATKSVRAGRHLNKLGKGTRVAATALFFAICNALSFAIVTRVDEKLVASLQTGSIGLGMASKALQIVENHRTAEETKLAMSTQVLSLAGACARVFTSVSTAKDDLLLILSPLTTSILSAVIVYQVYANRRDHRKHKSL